MRVSSPRRRRLLQSGSVLVLLLAVLPQVLYLGHPGAAHKEDAAARTLPTGHQQHDQAAAKHANHCHVGPKSCAASDGAIQVASFDTLVDLSNRGGTVSAVEVGLLPRDFSLWQRPEKPPQHI